MSAIIEAWNLARSYNGVPALNLPELRVEEGECLALTGRNGSGKSTLLRILAFLEKPDFGKLVYHGNSSNPRREVTLLLQDPYLLKCSVFQNVTLGLRLRGDTKNLEKRYEKAMHEAGFADPMAYASRTQSMLSGGERQRVALAARLAIAPRVLLLDEPTAHVDAASEKIIYASVKACLERGVTILCATHDRALFDSLDAREVVLEEQG